MSRFVWVPENLKQERKTNWYFMKTIIIKKKHWYCGVELLFLWTLLSLFLSVLSVGLTFCWAGFYWDIRDILCWIFNEAHEVHEVQDLSIALLLSAFLTVYKVNHSVCVPLSHINTHTHNQSCGFGVCREFKIAPSDHILVWYWFWLLSGGRILKYC